MQCLQEQQQYVYASITKPGWTHTGLLQRPAFVLKTSFQQDV